MAKRNIFNRVPVRRVKRAGFDLSSKVITTMEMGKLYPVGTPILAIPGDKHKLSHQVVAHAMPMGSPAFADITMYFLDFFVPFRTLYPDIDEHLFERFIANEPLDNGETAVLPRMNKTDVRGLNHSTANSAGVLYSEYDSLWDYFAFQTGVKPEGLSAPLDAPWRAYWQIWNEFIRDEKLQDAVDWSAFAKDEQTNKSFVQPAFVNYARDYLTSAFLSPQQGEAVSLPLSGYAPIVGDYNVYGGTYTAVETYPPQRIANNVHFRGNEDTAQAGSALLTVGSVPTVAESNSSTMPFIHTGQSTTDKHIVSGYVDEQPLVADLSAASTYDINDLRLANALQRWKEINNKCGTRYAEFLRAQYGVAPRDERLQRPEFIGGTKCPIMVSQVLQTSNSDSQQSPTGFKYGQGMAVDSDYSGTYFVKEFGLIMTLAYIRPKTLYQDGITREWTPETYLDFMNPLYVGLGEQGIKNGEVFAVNDETQNRQIWGYQSMYQELRYRSDRVTGKMRSNVTTGMNNSFDYWHLGRHFESLPQLNSEFIKCNPSTRIFQAGNTEIQFICEIGNIVKSLRPLPYYAVPRF